MKKVEQIAAPIEPPVDESKLRKVSITTNQLLFNAHGDTFDTNQKVFELINLMRNKYRIFLITQVSADGAVDHLKAKADLQPLIDNRVVKEHRVMYCTTTEGKKSLVRQLSAQLHIETDPQIIEGL